MLMVGHITSTVQEEIISVMKKGLSCSGRMTFAASAWPSRLPQRLENKNTKIHMVEASTSASGKTWLTVLLRPPGMVL